MLTLVQNSLAPGIDRLSLASAHLESAIVHINNVAQVRIGGSPDAVQEVQELGLIVRALADIVDALRTKRVAEAHPTPGADAAVAVTGQAVTSVMQLSGA